MSRVPTHSTIENSMNNNPDHDMLICDNDSNQDDHIESVKTPKRSCLNQSTNAFNKLTGMSDAALREKSDNFYENVMSPR
jgi:hypothetical protein